jgi:hypothetical protein
VDVGIIVPQKLIRGTIIFSRSCPVHGSIGR